MFNWEQRANGDWVCEMPANITLVAVPDRYKGGKPARGTKWRAACNHWNERTRTLSRYGRDEYMNPQNSAKAAMKLAEDIYNNRLT